MYLYCRSEVALEANIYHHQYLNTNSTESLNNCIKVWQDYKKEEISKFVVDLEDYVSQQQKDCIKPFINAPSNFVANPR